MGMRQILPLLLLTGCASSLIAELPEGDGRIEVQVPEGAVARLTLNGALFSESRWTTGPGIFDGLGPGRYAVEVTDCAAGSYPDPARHEIELGPDATASVESAILEGAHVRVTTNAVWALYFTEPVLDLPLSAQVAWIDLHDDALQAGAEPADDGLSAVLAPESEPYYVALLGLFFTDCSPMVIRRIGVAAAGGRFDLGAIDVPEWDERDVRLEGRILGIEGSWIMTLLPEREGIGAILTGEGEYRVYGLPPGRYRARILTGDRDRAFEMEIPAGPETRDLVVP